MFASSNWVNLNPNSQPSSQSPPHSNPQNPPYNHHFSLSNHETLTCNMAEFHEENVLTNSASILSSSPLLPHPPAAYNKPPKKDRHSKIRTAQGVRDRRVRLSIGIAREFFDLQDMLGYDKASKTLEWLFTKSKKAIREIAVAKKQRQNDGAACHVAVRQVAPDPDLIINNSTNNVMMMEEIIPQQQGGGAFIVHGKEEAWLRARATDKICCFASPNGDNVHLHHPSRARAHSSSKSTQLPCQNQYSQSGAADRNYYDLTLFNSTTGVKNDFPLTDLPEIWEVGYNNSVILQPSSFGLVDATVPYE